MVRFKTNLVYYSFTMPPAQCDEPSAASHFGRVCAGSITGCGLPPSRLRPESGNCNSPINAFLTLTAVTKW